MAAPLVIACPSCHSGTQEPHCPSRTCNWKVCSRCQLALMQLPAGEVRTIPNKQTA